jgi:hypothetical protein
MQPSARRLAVPLEQGVDPRANYAKCEASGARLEPLVRAGVFCTGNRRRRGRGSPIGCVAPNRANSFDGQAKRPEPRSALSSLRWEEVSLRRPRASQRT